MDARSQWIWLEQGECIDQYGEFYDSFDFDGQKPLLRISADANYAVYVNGNLVYSGQYPDFPHVSISDRKNRVCSFCQEAANPFLQEM